MAKKQKRSRLERIATPIRKDTFAEADEHRKKILEKKQLMGLHVVKCKVVRRGGKLGAAEYFDVIPYRKVVIKAEEDASKEGSD